MSQIYTSLEAFAGPASVVTIGNFDGVHLGHRRLLGRVIELARQLSAAAGVLTFDPHPARVLAPQRAPKLLTTREQRLELLSATGVDFIVLIPFTREFSFMSAEEFAVRVLREGLRARAVVVGENFRFGHRAEGDVGVLRRLGEIYGFAVEVIPRVDVRGQPVSSSAIRSLVERGRVGPACRMLGRPYTIEGRIVPGRGVGSRQTVPTLNLEPFNELLPARGVYITRTTEIEGSRTWPSITNVGVRPTFDGDSLTVETFLLQNLDGAAPAAIRLSFLRWVREERKFESPEQLREQILRDVERARSYFRRVEVFGGLKGSAVTPQNLR
jgi:riboflavin kinase/FMN adenylyltransferase